MFSGSKALDGATEIFSFPGTAAVTVTVAEADAAAVPAKVAVMVTTKLPSGCVDGAVNVVGTPLAVAAGETVPHRAFGQDTDHATPLVAEAFVTVAVNCAVELDCIVAELGETVSEIGGGELAPELQPERIVAVKYPVAIKEIQEILLVPRMATHSFHGE